MYISSVHFRKETLGMTFISINSTKLQFCQNHLSSDEVQLCNDFQLITL